MVCYEFVKFIATEKLNIAFLVHGMRIYSAVKPSFGSSSHHFSVLVIGLTYSFVLNCKAGHIAFFEIFHTS